MFFASLRPLRYCEAAVTAFIAGGANAIAAVTGMSRTAIQRDAELYLLQRGLMKINGTREITRLGTEVLNEVTAKGF